MAKPIINTTSSVLGFLQWQAFEFQPFALNTPTGWTSSALPEGVTLNGTTGLISGAAEKPGVYVVALYATNADGTSEPVIFTFGIEATAGDPLANVVDLRVDLGTRAVGRYVGDVATGPLFICKRGDELIFRVQFERGGAAASSLVIEELKLYLKEADTGAILCQSSAFSDETGGVVLVAITIEGEALDNALVNYEDEAGTMFPALWELEWLAENSLGLGSDPLRGSSQTFRGDVVRDLGELTP